MDKSNHPSSGLPPLIYHTPLCPYISLPPSLSLSQDVWAFLSPHGVGLLIGLWLARHSSSTPNHVELESIQYRKYSKTPVFTHGLNDLTLVRKQCPTT